MPIIEL